jgi:hypothetical protein
MTDENHNILKGNFKTKRKVASTEAHLSKTERIQEELKKKALSSLGGSMVYVERRKLVWEENPPAAKSPNKDQDGYYGYNLV